MLNVLGVRVDSSNDVGFFIEILQRVKEHLANIVIICAVRI